MKVQNEHKGIIQFLKFNVVGVINTAVDFGVFTLLNALGVFYMTAQVISYSCGVLNSFVLNRYWTFSGRGMPKGSEFLKFILVNLVSLGISLTLLYFFKSRWGMGVFSSKIIATLGSMVVNFAGNKLWVFKHLGAT